MKIDVKNADIRNEICDVLVVNLFEGVKNPSGATGVVNEALNNKIVEFVIEKDGFNGEFGSFYTLPVLNNEINAKKVIIAGLGKQEDFNLNKLRELSAKILKECKKNKTDKNVVSILHGAGTAELCPKCCAKTMVEGLTIANYKFDKYLNKEEKDKACRIETFTICENDESKIENIKQGLNVGLTIAKASSFAKDLINEGAYVVTPEKLANTAKNIQGVDVKVYDKKDIEKMNMGAYLAVARGSINEPRFIHLTYKPKNPNGKKVAIIGKGITFDSGGMDLKPPSSMLNMKDDMSGAACVLGVFTALADLDIKTEVHGIIAACENMISGRAYKPGDILTAKNGKTIEVDNTDAEGRLTLADALCFADELNVDEVIDVATLTGACMVALGTCASGIMGTNQDLIDRLIETSKASDEKLWQLPMYEEYDKSLKSDIADMKNTGSRYGGASTAGVFLSKFITNNNWAHIDIAGTAFLEKPDKFGTKMANGSMVRTLLYYLKECKCK